MIKDPVGAYYQLIRLQEFNKHDEEVPSMEIGATNMSFDSNPTTGGCKSTSRGSLGAKLNRDSSIKASLPAGVSFSNDVQVGDEGKKQCDVLEKTPQNISIG